MPLANSDRRSVNFDLIPSALLLLVGMDIAQHADGIRHIFRSSQIFSFSLCSYDLKEKGKSEAFIRHVDHVLATRRESVRKDCTRLLVLGTALTVFSNFGGRVDLYHTFMSDRRPIAFFAWENLRNISNNVALNITQSVQSQLAHISTLHQRFSPRHVYRTVDRYICRAAQQ